MEKKEEKIVVYMVEMMRKIQDLKNTVFTVDI